MYDIVIPSCKPYALLRLKISAMKLLDHGKNYNYIPTGFNASAAINRNAGLYEALKSDNEYIIMIDDDIGGFYSGWQNDIVKPLIEFSSVRISSARLLTPDGSMGPMMGIGNDLGKDICEAQKIFNINGYKFGAILSAAIAFRKKDLADSGINFDNRFIGSGFEDTLFCYHLSRYFEQCRFVCYNKCKLIHYHEMKSQNKHFEFNQKLFLNIVADDIKHRRAA